MSTAPPPPPADDDDFIPPPPAPDSDDDLDLMSRAAAVSSSSPPLPSLSSTASAAASMMAGTPHTRRKSAMNIFDQESQMSFAELENKMRHNNGSPKTSNRSVSSSVSAASFSSSSSLSSNSSVPPSPVSVSGLTRATSASTAPGTAPLSATSSASSSLMQRRGSDFRARVGSLPSSYSQTMPAASAGNKSKCSISGCTAFSSRYAFCLRHVWKMQVEELEPLNQKQYQVAKELVTTEKTYCEGLRTIYKNFYQRIVIMNELEISSLGGGSSSSSDANHGGGSSSSSHHKSLLLDPASLQAIFHNIEDLFKLSENMYGDLEEITLEKVLTTQIGTTMLHYAPQFRIYQTYLENYDDAIKTLGNVRKEKPEFDLFCKLQEKCENMSLESFLIMPVQRLPRYLLLLTELIKRSEHCTHIPSSSLADMSSAKDKISNIASSINQSLHQKENQLKVLAIQNQFEKDSRYQDLATPTRYLVREGPLKKRYGKESRHLSSSTIYHFFLFNDVLVYADFSKNVLGKGVTYKLKHLLPLNDMVVEAIAGAKGKNKDISVSTMSGGAEKAFDLSCLDTADRDSWLRAMQGAITKLREESVNLKTTSFDGTNQSDKAAKSSKLKAMLMGV